MGQAQIFIIDDDPHLRTIMSTALARHGHHIDTAEDGDEGMQILKKKSYDLVLCDLMMPKADGMQVLQFLQKQNFEGNFIMVTAHGTIEKAVDAIKNGAFDFLVKPVNLKELDVTVQKSLENTQLRRDNQRMRQELREKGLPNIIGKSAYLLQVLQVVDRAAGNNSTVLITGPSGTGKELIARRLHYQSQRVGNPFVVVNCGAIPGPLLESQLFGYVKGSFTGAEQDREGLFHHADGGTLFLDEVGELDLNLQVKILRAIQEGDVRRVGSNETEHVDVRLIAATNRNLAEEVKRGQFREDLYYRLNVVGVEMPPLKSRLEDLPELVTYFMSKYNAILGKNITSYAENFLHSLSSYDFPGNIRELENIVQKAMILTDGKELTAAVLLQKGGSFSTEDDSFHLGGTQGLHEMVASLEKQAIQRALKMFNANHSKVAQYLKIPRSTLYKKLHDYGIDFKKA